MTEKIKLTELTREELKQVTGGRMGSEKCNCDNLCTGNKQTFGQADSASKGGTDKPPISTR